MIRYVYEAMLTKKVRIDVIAENDDDAWDALMEIPADEWETHGVPVIEEIEVLEAYTAEED
jgi:hypothetical protein